jgi:hypothetical protein
LTHRRTGGAGRSLSVSATLEPIITPEEAIGDLKDDVTGLGLAKGLTTALNANLNSALAALDADDTAGACDSLQAFLNQVAAQSGKKLDADDAEQLTDVANAIREQLDC